MMLFNIPWWIILIGLLVIFSGYMAIRAIRAEEKLENEFIEREGSVYIERMESEKSDRRQRAV